MKRGFFLLNAAFAMAVLDSVSGVFTSCFICYHATQIAEIFHIVHLLLIGHNLYWRLLLWNSHYFLPHLFPFHSFFPICREFQLHTGTWSLDSRDCKRFLLNTGFQYAQGPFQRGQNFTIKRSRPWSYYLAWEVTSSVSSTGTILSTTPNAGS